MLPQDAECSVQPTATYLPTYLRTSLPRFFFFVFLSAGFTTSSSCHTTRQSSQTT